MSLPKKEKELRFNELRKMFFPEQHHSLLKSLGIDLPKDENNIFVRLENAEYKGLELLNTLHGRLLKCILHGAEKTISIDDVIYETELLHVEDNLKNIYAQFFYMKKNIQSPGENFNWHLFYNIIETAIWIGYHSGAHDMKIPIERHANSGFLSNVFRPQLGGNTTASRFIPVQNLIKKMADFILHNNVDVKISKAGLARAIFFVIKDFSSKNMNKKLEALTPFQHRYPSNNVILKQLNDYAFSSAKNGKKISDQKMIELLQKEFSPSVIKNYLLSINQ
ncbi:MAG: hypothetical protein PHV54_05555 [Tolumonas sp.]|nr:hypothetical protein [Tolumonas sp.]